MMVSITLTVHRGSKSVTELALNLSTSRPDIESSVPSSNYNPEHTTRLFPTAESQETMVIHSARYINSTHSNPIPYWRLLWEAVHQFYHDLTANLTYLSQANLTDSHDEIAVNPIIFLFTLAFASTTIICIILRRAQNVQVQEATTVIRRL